MNDFMGELDNKSQEDRLLFRRRVRSCSVDDLVNVSEKYLFNKSKISVIAGESFEDEIKSLGFKLKNI